MCRKFVLKKVLLCFVISFLSFLYSCDSITFSPEKKNNVDVTIPTPVSNIVLNSTTDTIYITGITTLQYSIDTKEKRFRMVKFYVDSLYAGATDNSSSYEINSNTYTSGYHKLKIEIWVQSGSGSMLDLYGKEYIYNTKEFNIFIDNWKLSDPPEIDSIYTDDALVRIKWQKYPYCNFKKYLVYSAIDGSSDFQLLAQISNQEQSFWYDSSYIGGNRVYRIDIVTSIKTETGAPRSFADKPLFLYPVQNIENENVILKWKKTKFYRNFKNYSIYKYYSGSPENHVKVAVIDNIADTSFSEKLVLSPDDLNYYVRVEGGSQYTPSHAESNISTTASGVKIPYFNGIKYIPPLNSIYIDNCIRVDPETLNEKSRGRCSAQISNNGNYAYTTDYSEDRQNSFTKVDPLTFRTAGISFTTESFMNYHSTIAGFIVLDNGTLFYKGYRFEKNVYYVGPPVYVLVDTDPVKVLQKDSTLSYPSGMCVSNFSDEGQYVFISDENYLFNFKNNAFTKRKIDTPGFVSFLESGKEYITVSSNEVSIYSCSNSTLIRSFNIPKGLAGITYDQKTGFIGGTVSGEYKYRIYDLNDGSLVKEILINNNIEKIFMVYSYLFYKKGSATDGYCTKLNFTK